MGENVPNERLLDSAVHTCRVYGIRRVIHFVCSIIFMQMQEFNRADTLRC